MSTVPNINICDFIQVQTDTDSDIDCHITCCTSCHATCAREFRSHPPSDIRVESSRVHSSPLSQRLSNTKMFRCRPPFTLHINPLRFSVRTCVPRIRSLHITQPRRNSANEPFDPMAVERVEDEVDVCIVGGGPAGLSAAIRLKQLEREKGNEIRVVVLEKGGEVGMCSQYKW